MPRETVSIVRSEGDVVAAVQTAIVLAGGLPDVAGKRVVVKPNLMCPASSGSARVTDCRVSEGIIRAALEQGASEVTIAEGSAVGFVGPTDHFDTLEAFQVSGHAAVAERLGAKLVDLNRDDFREVEVPGAYGLATLPLARTLEEADLVISVPVFKVHGYSGLTLACKNLQGVMPWRNKRRTHRVGLDAGLSDINAVVKPGFAVVDGIAAQVSRGTALALNMVVAGRNCTAADATCARIVGFPADRMALLRFNAERGLGVHAEEDIEVKGLSVAEAAEIAGSPWDWPPNGPMANMTQVDWVVPDAYPCSACAYGACIGASYVQSAHGPDAMQGLRIAFGSAPNGTKNVQVDLVVGDCAAEWAVGAVHVPGRAPLPAIVAAEICRICDLSVAPVIALRKRIPGSDWPEIKPLA